tara:strand:+ start:6800 stop:9892 length:3093 start_codon:yes stop_codon:yes gene_type:complete
MKFAHIADTHIRNLRYHAEYRSVFKQLYDSIKKENVDYIIHCGDIAHTKTQISPEFVDMCSEFLSSLADIAPTYIILGNHDGNLKNSGRLDAISPIVEALEHPDLHLLKNSCEVYLHDGFALNVLSVFDEDNWQDPTSYDNINIALYHGSISNCQTDSGWVMESGENEIEIFEEFDYAFLGDIHKAQKLDKAGRVRYPGSTVQQNFGEENDKGILIWDIQDRDSFAVKQIVFSNPKPFMTVELENGKLPDIEVPTGARLRLASTENITLENMKRAIDIARHKYSPESLTFLNRNIHSRGDIEEVVDNIRHDDLRNIVVQRKLIKDFLEGYELEDIILKKILDLNDKYNRMAEENEEVQRNVNWKLQSLSFDNLFNYGGGNVINFNKLNGIIGIFGKNFSGKSSIIDGLLYTMFNTTSKNERKSVNVINYDKDSAFGKVELKTADGSRWVIDRTLEKHTKKSKGEEIIEAKTSVEFNSYYDDATENHNGMTRAETDKIIRSKFGTVDDFLLTSMSSQLDSLSFIREGSTKRKEIFAKFLDLELFDKKFKYAKQDASDIKGALKRLEGKDFSSEIDDTTSDLADAIIEHEDLFEDKEKSKQAVLEIIDKISNLQQKIDNVPAEPIDITSVISGIRITEEGIAEYEASLSGWSDKLITLGGLIEEIDRFLVVLDIPSLKQKKQQMDNLQAKIDDHGRKLVRIERKISSLEDPEFLRGCKCLREAEQALASKPTVENDMRESKDERLSLDPEIVVSNIEKHESLVKKKDSTVNEKNRVELSIERAKNSISSEKIIKSQLESQKEKYEENKEAIENLEKLLKEKTNLEQNDLVEANSTDKDLDNKIRLAIKRVGSLEQRIENLKEQQGELEDLRKEYSAYDLYLKCTHSNGIAYDIIKKKLPIINEEIAKFLVNIVDFGVFFEDDGKRLNIHIQHPHQDPRPLEMGSGAEKTIAAMAIRLAILSVSNLPKGDIFILDEPGTALDEENMEGFTRMLNMIKSHFKTVLLISHLETLKDCVDMQISIEQKGGHAFVDC